MTIQKAVVRSSLLVVFLSLLIVASLPANVGGPIDGFGNSGRIAKFTASDCIGNSAIREDASGNVGIGTTNPAAKFLVAGGRLAVNANAGGSVGALIANQNGSGPIATFSTSSGSNVRMVVESTGNVGIGTPSPNSALEVAGIVHSTSGGIMFPDGTVQTSAALSTDGRIPISQPMPGEFPIVINQPGSYFLSQTITGESTKNGIEIRATDVTLDLNGFSLIGAPGSMNGIEVFLSGTNQDVLIVNGKLRSWGKNGIDVPASESLEVELAKIRAVGNLENGIQVACESNIIDCRATENVQDGINVQNGSQIRGCTSRDNGGNGIVASNGCWILDNHVDDHCDSPQSGINITGSHNVIESNQVSDCDIGIKVDGTNNLIVRNRVSSGGCGGPTHYSVPNNNNDLGQISTNPNTALPWGNLSFP